MNIEKLQFFDYINSNLDSSINKDQLKTKKLSISEAIELMDDAEKTFYYECDIEVLRELSQTEIEELINDIRKENMILNQDRYMIDGWNENCHMIDEFSAEENESDLFDDKITVNSSTHKIYCKDNSKYDNRINKHFNLFDDEEIILNIIEIINQLDNSDLSKKNNCKYPDVLYIQIVIEFLHNGGYYSKYVGDINGDTIQKKHQYYCEIGVYDELYNRYRKKYLSVNTNDKLKFISTDSTFIINRCGTDGVDKSGHVINKRGIKIHILCDSFRAPIEIIVGRGNEGDITETIPLFEKYNNVMKPLLIDLNDSFFLADKAYDSDDLRNYITNLGLKPLILQKKNRINFKKFTKAEMKIYNKRVIVENCFSFFKYYLKVLHYTEKKMDNYVGYVKLAAVFILSKKM